MEGGEFLLRRDARVKAHLFAMLSPLLWKNLEDMPIFAFLEAALFLCPARTARYEYRPRRTMWDAQGASGCRTCPLPAFRSVCERPPIRREHPHPWWLFLGRRIRGRVCRDFNHGSSSFSRISGVEIERGKRLLGAPDEEDEELRGDRPGTCRDPRIYGLRNEARQS